MTGLASVDWASAANSLIGLGWVRLELRVYELRLQVHQMVATAMDALVPLKEPKEPHGSPTR